jgi:hypothetical protein
LDHSLQTTTAGIQPTGGFNQPMIGKLVYSRTQVILMLHVQIRQTSFQILDPSDQRT